MKNFFFLLIASILIINVERVKALVPYYYLPSSKSFERESIFIGKNAYQLLYFGNIKDALNLAKLAVKINKLDEKLWLILSEAQMANALHDDALISLEKAEKINPKMGEIYFSKSTIYLKKSKFKKAKLALESGLKIQPNNHNAIFQIGNIFLMEKKYLSAIRKFDEAVEIKPDFWQAINNIGLAYFEEDKINLSSIYFQKAISIEENAEPLLALASCLLSQNKDSSITLVKKALVKNPNYVDYNFRKEQLWGEKLQNATEDLFKSVELRNSVILAKSKINKGF